MKSAAQIMHTPAPTVTPDTSAQELYTFLTSKGLDGVCVVEGDKLVGVVTSMDLVFREKKVHMPTFFFFLDAVIPLGDPRRTYEEVTKIAGSRAGDLASTRVVTVAPDTHVDDVASLMVDKHLSVVPVVDGQGTLVGMVTKDDVLRASFGPKA